MDRHLNNYAIIEKGNVPEIVIFDNELMLSEVSTLLGGYSIGMDEYDYFFKDGNYDENEENLFHKFLRISDESYREIVEDKLWIIDRENIEKALLKVEKRVETKIPNFIKNDIKRKFDNNRNMINKVLEETNERRL